jgi:glycosyltransferase involved in cell wall biosynthesis/predicted Zn-dependent protease
VPVAVVDAGRGTPHNWVQNQCTQAVAIFRGGDSQRALALVDEVLRRRPGERVAVEIGALISEQAGDLRRAGRYLSVLMAGQPGAHPRRRALARVLMQAGRPEAAADVLEATLGDDPVGSGALAEYLAATRAAAPPRKPERMLLRLAESLGTSPPPSRIIRLADELAAQGALDIAAAWLDRDWQDVIETKAVTFLKGKLLYTNGRQLDAERFFEQVREWDDPRQLDARLFLARIARLRANEDLTFDRYLDVYALRPQNEECLSFLVRHYLNRRDFDVAGRYIAELEAAAPRSRHLAWLNASLAYRNEKPDEAIAVFRRAIANDPEAVENYGHFADLLSNMGDLEQAAEVLEAGVRGHSSSLFLLTRMLQCAERRKRDAAEVLDICDRILAADPVNEYGIRRRASTLLSVGRRAEAMAQFVDGSRLYPNNILLWRAAAQIASRNRFTDDLNRLLARAREQFGDGGADAAANLAYVLEAAGAEDEAAIYAQRGLSSEKGAMLARQVIARQSTAIGDFARAWPHLVELQQPADRSIETVRLYAQVAAGFRAVRPSQAALVEVEPIEGRFPDLVFEEAVRRAPILDAAECRPVVFQVTSTLGAGGAERQVALTCQAMSQSSSGLTPELIAEDLSSELGRDFFLPQVVQAGVPVSRLRELHSAACWRELIAERPELRPHIRLLSSLPLQAQRIALPLYVLLVRNRPQVVHLWQDMIAVAGGLAAVLAGVPTIVLGIRSTRPVEIQRARPFFHGAYRAMLRRPGISMVGNSANGARDYEDWLGLSAGNVAVVANACDFRAIETNISPTETQRIRDSFGIPPDAPVLGGVMRCSYEKRPELWTAVAIDLAQRDPRFHGILVGDGPMMPELVAQVASAGLADRIHFAGRRTPIEPWMQAMDVLFLSSLTEGLPNVLIEAQAVGVAVATLRVGGAPEAVSEGRSALVIDEAPVAVVAGQIGELLNSHEWRNRLAQAGPAVAREKFSPESIVRQFTGIYGLGA